ncbi:hypothetical protein B7C62_12405 [Kitasatospora albolonga]|uniref:Integral membrane protein n=1 Tax=Kitasatospora albolonga TaxID=68173 RepID=A0ABC8BTA2_9ACTN|nr:hypothetical protein B7C62_12405 [Kitasatospora albolonga]
MHGYGYPPQQPPTSRPSSGTLIWLRVIFVALTVLSCGFLGWAALLRLAVVTRRARDWWLLAVVFVLTVGVFAYFGSLPDGEEELTDAQAGVGVIWLLVLVAGVITYYLIMDIRHFSTPGQGPYDSLRQTPVPNTNPYGTSVGHHQAPARPQHTTPSPVRPPTPNPYTVQAPPPTPAPQRLDQVRAELDELSDYLRKENKENKEGEGR